MTCPNQARYQSVLVILTLGVYCDFPQAISTYINALFCLNLRQATLGGYESIPCSVLLLFYTEKWTVLYLFWTSSRVC